MTVDGCGRAAAVAVLLGVLSVTVAARADAPTYAWWSSPATPAADVPERGLLVSGPAASPTSYAAVGADVAEGRVSLVLAVAEESASLPTSSLLACPLTTARFEPVDGGSIEDAPTYDCTAGAPGVGSPDGTSYSFDVGALVVDGRLAIALVPGSSATRVVFSEPSADALAFQAELPSTPSTTAVPQTVTTLAAPTTIELGPNAPTPSVAPPPVMATSVTDSEAPTSFTTAVASRSDGGDGLLVALMGAVAVSVLWGAARRGARRLAVGA